MSVFDSVKCEQWENSLGSLFVILLQLWRPDKHCQSCKVSQMLNFHIFVLFNILIYKYIHLCHSWFWLQTVWAQTSKLVEARYKRKDLDKIKHNSNIKSIVIKELLMKSKTMVECRTWMIPPIVFQRFCWQQLMRCCHEAVRKSSPHAGHRYQYL